MFSSKRRREPTISTLIGQDSRVNGDVEFTGGCLVDGYVRGNVTAVEDENAALSISERGCVEGDVEAPTIFLNGTVKGDVRASQRIELGSKARVIGNVQYGLIEMAIGAEINGKLIHESESGALSHVTL
jgi:cytoskeletal protein CcmA (bactofilin family)